MLMAVEKKAFSVLYDEIHKQPQWVANSLSKQELYGYARRKGSSSIKTQLLHLYKLIDPATEVPGGHAVTLLLLPIIHGAIKH